jgi:type I restriction enzyme R subunit
VTPPGKAWNEENLPENPLEALGYTFVSADALEAERESLKEGVLTRRLATALKRVNPWFSEDNVQKALRAVTNVPATSLIEGSEKLCTILTYGVSLEQDRGEGKKGYTVRFLDVDKLRNSELIVTRHLRAKGAEKYIKPFVNGAKVDEDAA